MSCEHKIGPLDYCLAQVADGVCRYAAAPERRSLWEMLNGPVPAGMRVGQTCRVNQCGKLEHMVLVEDKTSGWKNWKQYRTRALSLEMGESADWLDYPNDEHSIRNLITNLQGGATSMARFVVRCMPTGLQGIRITRMGTWFDGTSWDRPPLLISRALGVWLRCDECKNFFLCPQTYWEERKYCSILCAGISRRSTVVRGSTFYMGFLAFSASNRSEFVKRATCAEKGCVFPVSAKGLCHRHANFGFYSAAMRGAKLERKDLFGEDGTSHYPAISTLKAFEIEHSHENTIFVRQSAVDNKWKLTEEYLWEAAQKATADNRADILRYVRVTKEKLRDYIPEQRVVNHQGRGTRGGHPGSHKKVRKSQRKRPAGWHGSRPDHDVIKRWSRQTIDEVATWTPADNTLLDVAEIEELGL
jgi:hypothetical protein